MQDLARIATGKSGGSDECTAASRSGCGSAAATGACGDTDEWCMPARLSATPSAGDAAVRAAEEFQSEPAQRDVLAGRQETCQGAESDCSTRRKKRELSPNPTIEEPPDCGFSCATEAVDDTNGDGEAADSRAGQGSHERGNARVTPLLTRRIKIKLVTCHSKKKRIVLKRERDREIRENKRERERERGAMRHYCSTIARYLANGRRWMRQVLSERRHNKLPLSKQYRRGYLRQNDRAQAKQTLGFVCL